MQIIILLAGLLLAVIAPLHKRPKRNKHGRHRGTGRRMDALDAMEAVLDSEEYLGRRRKR